MIKKSKNQKVDKKSIKAAAQAVKLHAQLRSLLEETKNGKYSKSRKIDMLSLHDFAELIKYSRLIMENQLKKAKIMQRNMDTVVYEFIPDNLWMFIEYGDF